MKQHRYITPHDIKGTKSGYIGKSGDNFENVWWAVSQPGGQYYIPDPGPPLDCPTMETYRESMRNSKDYWSALLAQGGLNDEEVYYATLISNWYVNRMQQYADVMIRTCTTPGTGSQGPATALPTGGDGSDVLPTPSTATTTDIPPDTNPPASQPNYLMWIALAGGAALILLPKPNKNKSKKVTGLGSVENIVLIGGIGYLLYSKFFSGGGVADKKQSLLNWANNTGQDMSAFVSAVTRMSDAEITDTYNFVYNYFLKNIQVPANTDLYNHMVAISNKYGIFT